MIVKLEDLEPGDEILFPTNGSQMVRAVVLVKPVPKAVTPQWLQFRGLKAYPSVKCLVHVEEIEISYGRWVRKIKKYIADGKYNKKRSIDLSRKETIWLINKDASCELNTEKS